MFGGKLENMLNIALTFKAWKNHDKRSFEAINTGQLITNIYNENSFLTIFFERRTNVRQDYLRLLVR